MENEMTFEMEMAIAECCIKYPEIMDVVIMLQKNDLRAQQTINRLVTTVEKTVDAMSEMSDTLQDMGHAINYLGKKVAALERQVEELENKGGENMEEKSTMDLCNDVVDAVENGSDDDFLAAYAALTNSLKAEVQQDIENEEEDW